jgi:acyl-CoA synthetase (AMP-forming)/AMP-acid ligase II/acyl carrier protein
MASSILDLMWQRRYHSEKKVFFTYKNEIKSQWSYGQILSISQSYSKAFSHLPPRTIVAICFSTEPEFLFSFFGCQLAGHIPAPYPSPMAIRMQKESRDHANFFKNSGIHHIITSAPELFSEIPELNILNSNIESKINPDIDTIDLSQLAEEFTIQFSSGSTSEPKGVIITHASLMTNLRQMSIALKVTPEDRLSSWLPLYHDMGLVGALMAPIYNQVPAYLSQPSDFIMDPIAWLNSSADFKTSIMVGPDFMYRNLAKNQKKSPDLHGDLSSLRICMSGSEPVLHETCRNFAETFAKYGLKSTALLPVYGMAEAVLGVTFPALESPLKISSRGHVSCGYPLDEIEIMIADEKGNACKEGHEGEILIRGPNITGRFLNSEDQTYNGFLKTGDLGYVENSELFISGRKKDVLILRGQKFHNLDLERKIQNLLGPESGRVAVVLSQTCLVIAVETENWLLSQKFKKTISHFIQSLDSEINWTMSLVPKGFLARTTSGKLKRHQIVRDFEQGRLGSNEFDKLKFLLSEQIKRLVFVLSDWRSKNKENLINDVDPLFEKILRVLNEQKVKVPITMETQISELGLDSVQTLELISKIESDFGKIDLIDFLELKTIHDLYLFLSSRR